MPDTATYAWAFDTMNSIVHNVERVVYGKTTAVRIVVAALAAEGHVLLEDVPGTGKTSLASALASSACAWSSASWYGCTPSSAAS